MEVIADKKPPRGRGNTTSQAGLTAILIVGAVIRFAWLGSDSQWFDELYSSWVRKLPIDELVSEVLAAGHPPVYNLAAHYWSMLGSGDAWARSLSATCGVITVGLAYACGKELFDRRTGLWAAALSAVSPLLVWFSREATSYSWLTALSLASFYLLARSARHGGWRNWSAYVAITTVAFFSHFFSPALFVAGFCAYWFLRDPAKSRLASWAISQMVLTVALFLSLLLGRMSEANSTTISRLHAGKFFYGLAAAPYTLLAGKIGDNITRGSGAANISGKLLALLAISVLLLAGLAIAWPRMRMQLAAGGTLAVAVFSAILVVGPLLLLTITDDKTVAGRYYVWATPTVLLLIAIIISAIPHRAGYALGGTIVIGLTALTGWQLFNFHNWDMRTPMTIVSEEREAGDQMFCVPLHQCTVAAAAYITDPLPIGGGWLDNLHPDQMTMLPEGTQWTGYHMAGSESIHLTPSELDKRLASELSGANRVWLVSGDGSVSDFMRADIVEASMLRNNWQEAAYRHPENSPLTVRLYTRPG
jgi:uncharacterized membrane protein